MLESLKALVAAFGVDWLDFKIFLHHAMAINHDALHVIVGVVLQLLLVIAARSSLARFWPWAMVLLAELANEWNDLRVDTWPDVAEQWGEVAKDIGLTMLLPTLLLILARSKPKLFGLSEPGL
jgi:diacylglycerol kinase